MRISLSSGPAVATDASSASVLQLPDCGSKSWSFASPVVGPGCGTSVSTAEYGEVTSVVASLTYVRHWYALVHTSRPAGTVHAVFVV